jgi:hypothetical protein
MADWGTDQPFLLLNWAVVQVFINYFAIELVVSLVCLGF